jgi:hypothetical protein
MNKIQVKIQKNKSHKGKESKLEPSDDQLIYSGPIAFPGEAEGTAHSTQLMVFTGVVASSVGGAIDTNYSDDPNSYALAEWTALVGLFKEYRTLGFEVELVPYNKYNSSNVKTSLVTVADRDSSVGLGSYQTACSHASSKLHVMDDHIRVVMKSSGAEEMQFRSTSGTTGFKWIKFYSDGLSISQNYYRAIVRLLIQFRNRA